MHPREQFDIADRSMLLISKYFRFLILVLILGFGRYYGVNCGPFRAFKVHHPCTVNIVKQACLSQQVRFSTTGVVEVEIGEPKSSLTKEWKLTEDLTKIMGFKFLEGHHGDIQGVKQDMLRHLLAIYHDKKHVPVEFLEKLLSYSTERHLDLPNIIAVNRHEVTDSNGQLTFTSTLTVVGDTHGQFEDFTLLFENKEFGLFPSEENAFIFNGDMVDRGDMGLEIVTVLLFAKLLFPNSIHLIRGNHESEGTTTHYGFRKEVCKKYSEDLYQAFIRLFDALPVGAVVNRDAFVVHGGIGPHTHTVEQLNALQRSKWGIEIDELLWSDPNDRIEGVRKLERPQFGKDVTAAFLQRNDLKYIIRSHEVAMQGYELHHNNKLVTVFSAPFYCGYTRNMGAVIRYDQPDSNHPVAVQFPPSLWLQQQGQPQKKEDSKGWVPLAAFTPSKRIDLPLIPKSVVVPAAEREGEE